MKSLSRKRYVRSNENNLCANEDIPWGHDSVITLEFNKGKYSIRDSAGRYLNGETGELESSATQDCMFSISLQDTEFAFKSSSGKYLTVYGPTGKLMANKKAISRDELFVLEESKAQVMLTASNGKTASIKQGIILILYLISSLPCVRCLRITSENYSPIHLVVSYRLMLYPICLLLHSSPNRLPQ